MPDNDLQYYARRERQERERAQRSEHAHVRRVHAELADRYSALARDAAGE